MVLIQTLGDDFLWGGSNSVTQHGAQEVVESPADGVSNSICSRSAGRSVLTPSGNLPFCSLLAEEMLGLLIRGANRQSIRLKNHLRLSLYLSAASSNIYDTVKGCSTRVCFLHWLLILNLILIIEDNSSSAGQTCYNTLLPSSVSNQLHNCVYVYTQTYVYQHPESWRIVWMLISFI